MRRGLRLPVAAVPLLFALAAGCAPGSSPAGREGAGGPHPPGETGAAAPSVSAPSAGARAGAGTLRQDDVTLTLGVGPLQVKVTPLAEEILRLLAPDTRDRLRALAGAHGGGVGGGEGRELFLVSAFSSEAGATFRERELTLVVDGMRERAREIRPVTPGWSGGRLGAMETQAAVYAFPVTVDYEQPWAVDYDGVVNDDWGRVIPLLQRERARVGGAAGA